MSGSDPAKHYLCFILVLPVFPGSEKGTLFKSGTVPAAVKPVPPVGGSLQPDSPPLFANWRTGRPGE